MKRFHVHLHVADIAISAQFYSTLFGTAPSVLKSDYAKWMLDDPKVNFAISARDALSRGVDHLGLEVGTDHELRELAGRLKSAGETTINQKAVTCCYAKGNKSWVNDPAGVRWETFFTFGDATTYGEDAEPAREAAAQACGSPLCCT